MTQKEYKKLCDVSACLNVSLAVMNGKYSGFTNPEQTQQNEVLKAYVIVGKMLTEKQNEKGR